MPQFRSDPSRVPALDGLRGIAIIGVLMTHSALHWGLTPLPIQFDGFLGSTGRVGVELFFVLSAFLITGILLDTKGAEGSLRTFYLRRALRILPLYYIVLGILAFQAPGAIAGREPWYWLQLSNWSMAQQGVFANNGYGVMWSLGIEEQFYLIWPFVVLAIPRRQLFGVAIGGVIAALIWRAVLVATNQPVATIITTTPSHFDSLGLGALLALGYRTPTGLAPFIRRARWTLVGSAVGLVALGFTGGGLLASDGLIQAIGNSLLAIGCGAIVLLALESPGIIRRVGETGALGMFGRYSYCLYLIHPPVGETLRVISYGQFWPVLEPLGAFGHLLIWAAIVATSLGISWLSWRYIEAPLLSLKRFLPYGPTRHPASYQATMHQAI